MPIITQQMIEDRVGAAELVRLSDDAGTGLVNLDVMAQAVSEGEGEILNNIAQRYRLPLAMSDSNTAAVVRTKLLDAIVYRLIMHRDRRVEDTIETAYRDAIKWSEAIATGRLGLHGETQLPASPAGGGGMMIAGSTPKVISRETMKGL